MAKISPIITNFTAGEVYKIDGRTDFAKYQNGCKVLENAHILAQGGAVRRGGFHFVKEVKFSNKATMVAEFEFSDAQAYILEIGDQYIRFYRNRGRIQPPAGISNAVDNGGGLIRITDVGHGIVTNDTIFIADVLGTTEANGAWAITRIDDDTYDLIGSTFSNAYVSGGEAVIEAVTPYLEADLFELQFEQSFDTLYIAHKKYAPRTLVRTSHTSWAVAKISFTGATFPSGFAGGSAGVGTDGNSQNPAAVTFIDERLGWGGTDTNPRTFWLSETGDFVSMNLGTGLDAEAVEHTLGGGKSNNIRWMKDGKFLMIGTQSREWSVDGGGIGNAITPGNIKATKQRTHGSQKSEPVEVGNVLLFIQKAGKKIRELVFNFDVDGFVAPDLNKLAKDISTGGIVEISYQQEEESILWGPRADGTLLGMTYERDDNVVAWHRHPQDGKCKSVAVIPTSDESRDELWAINERTVGGVDKKYVEYLDPDIFVDSGITYSGSPVTTLTGLTHLIGKTVQIVGDDAVFPDKVVDAQGEVTVSKAVSSAYIGLGYVTTVKPNRPIGGNPAGTAQGKKKRWPQIVARVENTQGIKINDKQIPFRKSSTPMDSPPPAFTGDIKVGNSGYDRDAFITIIQDQPLPMELVALMGDLQVNEF